jgi:transcriptional activator HAC1
VERVLRNRRAAQSSRERKRQEVEALEGEKRAIERRNHDLELRLADAEAKNLLLQQQIAQITGNMTVFNQSSPSSQYRPSPTPITFSQELFGSREASNSTPFEPVTEAHLNLQQSIQTVNPASLSPEIRPVTELSNASSSDMTQHPAVSVGRTTALDDFDGNQHFNLDSNGMASSDFSHYLDFPTASLSDHEFLENGVLPVADSFNLEYDHMASHHTDFTDDFNINDFLIHDNESAQPCVPPEIQSENESVEKTTGLQPPVGASLDGCDDGGHAVSV